MKKVCRFALVFGLAVLVASPALAQRQRGDRPRGERPQGFGGGSVFLLSQESVQKDLKLSDDQVTKVKELQKKQREALQGVSREERRTKMQEQAKATQKAVKEILKPEQQKRLDQITLQREGTRALSRKEVAEALKISDEQKEKIKTIREEARKETSGLRGNGNNQDARKKVAEIRKSSSEKVMNVLTSEQKAKLKELQGEPFNGEIKRPQFRGVEGRGGRQNRR
jgi:Spy/CpxP family protein refolding chaperone